MPLTPRHDLISATEAAHRLRISRPTVLHWVAKGRLTGELVAGVPYLRLTEVEALAASLAAARLAAPAGNANAALAGGAAHITGDAA